MPDYLWANQKDQITNLIICEQIWITILYVCLLVSRWGGLSLKSDHSWIYQTYVYFGSDAVLDCFSDVRNWGVEGSELCMSWSDIYSWKSLEELSRYQLVISTLEFLRWKVWLCENYGFDLCDKKIVDEWNIHTYSWEPSVDLHNVEEIYDFHSLKYCVFVTNKNFFSLKLNITLIFI